MNVIKLYRLPQKGGNDMPDANGIVSDKFSNYEDYIRKINGNFNEAGTVSKISNELNSQSCHVTVLS
jgi:hypothetical protein